MVYQNHPFFIRRIMDIFFSDPEDLPVPQAEVRIRELTAEPWPDSRRVKVEIHLTPFQVKPNIDIKIINSQSDEVAFFSIVEALQPKMDFTIHLREAETGGKYQVEARVFYTDLDSYDPDKQPESTAGKILEKVGETIDSAESTFEITP